MKKQIVATIFCGLCITSFGQASFDYKPTKYFISTQLAQQLKKYTFVDTGTLKGSMTIEVTWDGKPFFNQKNLDCFTFSILRNDTIYITGHMLGELGWGFQLALFGDSCMIGSFALSDEKMYKYNLSDSELLSFINLPSVTQKLTLSAKPTFKEGEKVAGLVELKSKDFYYIVDDSKTKSHISLSAFFKTAALKRSL